MDKNVMEIKGKIEELEQKLDTIDTRQTEVYARIVGYYRSVKNWNKGKKEEYQMRTPFVNKGTDSAGCGTLDYSQNKSIESETTGEEQPELMLQSETVNNTGLLS